MAKIEIKNSSEGRYLVATVGIDESPSKYTVTSEVLALLKEAATDPTLLSVCPGIVPVSRHTGLAFDERQLDPILWAKLRG